MATATKSKSNSQVEINLPKTDVQKFKLRLRGVSPLIVHKFSEKARKQIEEKQQKKATKAKEQRKPQEEYEAAFYMLDGKPGEKTARYGMTASSFKQAAVSACTFVDKMTKVFARGAFHVMEESGGLVEILSKAGPRMREDTVRLGGPGNSLDLRYRPEFVDWHCELDIRYNASAISIEQICNLFMVAGFSVGVGDWRPQKNGSYGMFEISE